MSALLLGTRGARLELFWRERGACRLRFCTPKAGRIRQQQGYVVAKAICRPGTWSETFDAYYRRELDATRLPSQRRSSGDAWRASRSRRQVSTANTLDTKTQRACAGAAFSKAEILACICFQRGCPHPVLCKQNAGQQEQLEVAVHSHTKRQPRAFNQADWSQGRSQPQHCEEVIRDSQTHAHSD